MLKLFLFICIICLDWYLLDLRKDMKKLEEAFEKLLQHQKGEE